MYDMLRHLYEIGTTTYESSSTFHDITRFLHNFWCILEQKEYVLLKRKHGHILILPREGNKYDYSFEYAFFDAVLYFFSGRHACPQNAIIRVDVCGARGWFLNEN